MVSVGLGLAHAVVAAARKIERMTKRSRSIRRILEEGVGRSMSGNFSRSLAAIGLEAWGYPDGGGQSEVQAGEMEHGRRGRDGLRGCGRLSLVLPLIWSAIGRWGQGVGSLKGTA